MRALVPLIGMITVGHLRSAGAESELYEPIRFDGGLTASSVGVADRGGVGVVAEIKAVVHDNVAVGGRVEIAVMFGGVVGQDELPLDVSLAGSGLIKAELHGGTGTIRPFVAVGAGGYTIGSHTIQGGPNTSGISTSIGRYFGVAPEVGVDLGPVRIAATYNAILGASLEVRDMVGNAPQTTHVSQNYLSLELSFRFAGGRKAPARRATLARVR